MKAKTFDCVAMKRQGATRIRERITDLTLEQRIEYWRRRSEAFRREQQEIRRQESTKERA